MNHVYDKYQTEFDASQQKLQAMLTWLVGRYHLNHLIRVSDDGRGIKICHHSMHPLVTLWIVPTARQEGTNDILYWTCVQDAVTGGEMTVVDGYALLTEIDVPQMGPREAFLTNVIAQFFKLLIGREINLMKLETLMTAST